MTREKWASLSPQEQRLAVALHDRWHKDALGDVWCKDRRLVQYSDLPDYMNSLDVMHRAIEDNIKKGSKKDSYFVDRLADIMGLGDAATEWYESDFDRCALVRATAAQLAEAFVLTMDKEADDE